MSPEELAGLLEAGDLYQLMLRVTRAWLAKDHPDADYATVVASFGEGVPNLVIPIPGRPARPAGSRRPRPA